VQISLPFQSLQKGIECASADAVAVPLQFLLHTEAEDRLLHRVMKNVKANETGIKIAVFGHIILATPVAPKKPWSTPDDILRNRFHALIAACGPASQDKSRYTDSSMSHAGISARRLMLILFVLYVTVCTQSTSLGAEQETHHASDHCCVLCHLGPAPILPAVANAIVAPVFSPVWLAVAVAVRTLHEVLVGSTASRAPPA